MNTICRDIFRAIHERKWLSIEYKNGKDEVTKYWIGIMEIDPIRKSMHVMGLHEISAGIYPGTAGNRQNKYHRKYYGDCFL